MITNSAASAFSAPSISNVFVAMGSSDGKNPHIREEAAEIGALLAQNGYRLIYGGGEKGLMGLVYYGFLKENKIKENTALPCITQAFATMSGNLSPETRVEKHLHDRVAFMIDKAEATVVMPGGLGTLHEITTVLAVNDMMRFEGPNDPIQPVIVVNTDGFYNFQLLQLVRFAEEQQINPEKLRVLFVVESSQKAVELLNRMRQNPMIHGQHLFPGSQSPDYWPKSFADHMPKWSKQLALFDRAMSEAGLSEPFASKPRGPAPKMG